MSDAQVPEWLGRLADANKRIADLERIIGKQEEELHQGELRVAELEAENAGYKDGAQRLIESNTRLLKRAEQAEAELAEMAERAVWHSNKRMELEAELATLKGQHEWTMRESERLHDTTTSHWSVADVEARWQARAEEGGGE